MSRASILLSKFTEDDRSKDLILGEIIIDVMNEIDPEKDWKRFFAEVKKQAKAENVRASEPKVRNLLDYVS